MNIQPMLAIDYTPDRVRFPCFVQPKLNGIRAIYHNGRMFTRQGIEYAPALVAHITEELKGYVPKNIMLDGELYRHGMSLQEINSAISVTNIGPNEATTKVQYHVFDCSVDKEQNVLPFQRRWPSMVNAMPEYVIDTDAIQFVFPRIAKSIEEIEQLFKTYTLTYKYEGLILRIGNNYYQHGLKSKTLLRMKAYKDAEATVIGIEEGKGRLANTMGALVCRTKEGVEFRVGTGFDDNLRNTIWRHEVPPYVSFKQKEIKFKYETLSAKGVPLKPSFISFV